MFGQFAESFPKEASRVPGLLFHSFKVGLWDERLEPLQIVVFTSKLCDQDCEARTTYLSIFSDCQAEPDQVDPEL
jgi:hypothetical protein